VEQPVFVHCAANLRVSAFIYLYRQIKQNWSEEEAKVDLEKIWTPNKIWTQFIEEVIKKMMLSAMVVPWHTKNVSQETGFLLLF